MELLIFWVFSLFGSLLEWMATNYTQCLQETPTRPWQVALGSPSAQGPEGQAEAGAEAGMLAASWSPHLASIYLDSWGVGMKQSLALPLHFEDDKEIALLTAGKWGKRRENSQAWTRELLWVARGKRRSPSEVGMTKEGRWCSPALAGRTANGK
jgi:hypothetical protein